MSKKYVKIWQEYHGKKLPKNMEIHHIDGNRNNNEPSNLLAVTIEEHLNIHKKQNDYGAVQAILMRMNRTPEENNLLKESASKHQKKLLEQGDHNFQIPREERIKRSKEIIKERLKEHGVAFLGIKDSVENAKRARSFVSRETELRLAKQMQDKVRNTKWWVNKSGDRKRSKEYPGEGWKVGMKYEN